MMLPEDTGVMRDADSPSVALRCPKCLAEAGRYIGGSWGQVVGTYSCDQCGHVWRVKDAHAPAVVARPKR